MGIPQEDLPPVWIRDYDSLYDIGGNANAGGDGGTGVKVDTPAMKDFAAALDKNVDADYVPHARKVFDDMTARVTPTDGFLELQSALDMHRKVQTAATRNVAGHANGTKAFAFAADKISKEYAETDAYAAARMDDVMRYLGTTPAQTGTTDPSTTDPTTNPEGRV
jgi:hypothetical protein